MGDILKRLVLCLALLSSLVALSACSNDNSEYVTVYNYKNDGNTKKCKISSNKKLALDIPQIEGYLFDGAFSSEDYNAYINFAADFSDGDSLYFKWKKVSEYKELDSEVSLDSYIDSLISKTTSYVPSWNMEGFKGKWNYIDGVFLKSLCTPYEDSNDEEYMNFVKNYVDYYISSTGEFKYYSNNEAIVSNDEGFKSTELDTICESRILFDLYKYTNNTAYLNAIEYTYEKLCQMALCEGTTNYNHKATYPNQIWLDGMYMYAPFLCRYALLKNDTTIFSKLRVQYEYIYDHMRNKDGLYYHGMDTGSNKVFWADSETGCSQSIWLRSTGWLLVSLCDVLDYYPEGEDRDFLKNMLDEAVESISKYEDQRSKMYYQLVDKMNESFLVDGFYLQSLNNKKTWCTTYISNYLESSGSSMIAYTMMKGANKGYLDNKYYDLGKETFEGVYEYSFVNNELQNICITAGLGPDGKTYRDGSPAYYLAENVGANDAKGVGPFIMAYFEYIK